MKRLAWILIVLALTLVVISVFYWRRDHLAGFERRAGSLAVVDTLDHTRSPGPTPGHLVELRLANGRGLSLRARVRYPETARRLPAVLILAGLETGRDAAGLTPITVPAVQMSVDYPYDGPMWFEPGELLRAAPRLRSSLFDAAAACLLAVDYLAANPIVHPDSLFVVGCSFGAFFGPIVAAARPEVDGLVILQGGGGLRSLIRANMRWAGVESGIEPIAVLGAVVLHPFEPTRWVGRISPRPVTLVNSRGDQRIPPDTVERLFAAAREPKRLVWVDSGHLHPTDRALIARLTREVEGVLFGSDRD